MKRKTLEPQFITDKNGEKIAVILQIQDYKKILEDLDQLSDLMMYDKAKKEDDGTRIPMEKVFADIEKKRKKENVSN